MKREATAVKRETPVVVREALHERGFTLVELLVVIAIMGMLMAIGVGVWVSFRGSAARKLAYRTLAGACRRARVFSLEESAPSRLILARPGKGPQSFHAEGLRLVGFWHLEGSTDPTKHGDDDHLTGFAGRKLYESDGEIHLDGYRGTCLAFPTGGGITLPTDSLRLPRGGQFSCYLYATMDGRGRKQRILTRGKELEFVITMRGELEAQVGSAQVTTAGYRLPIDRWSHVALFYSPREVTISVDGVVRGRSDPREPVEMPDEEELDLPLEMGSGEWTLYGRVDEIAVHRAVREASYRLPESMKLVCGVDRICFDSAGMLDRRYHNGPVKVGIIAPKEGGKTETRSLTIRLTGEIRED